MARVSRGLKCGYCQFAKPFKDVRADFIINGQSVCEDHVDEAEESFGRSLSLLQRRQDQDGD